MRWSFLVVVLSVTHAWASPDAQQSEAEQLYSEGSKHYNLREYEPAIEAFKRAYDLYPEPTFLFDIAQAYRLLQDCDNAAVFYRNYLRAKPDADDRDKATQLATEMDSCAADQKRDREQRRERELAAQPKPVVVAEPEHRGARVAGIVTAAAGVALAGVGVYFSIDAADKAHRIEQLCMTSCNAPDVAPIDSSGKTSSNVAIAMYVLGGLAIGTGTGLLVWHF